MVSLKAKKKKFVFGARGPRGPKKLKPIAWSHTLDRNWEQSGVFDDTSYGLNIDPELARHINFEQDLPTVQIYYFSNSPEIPDWKIPNELKSFVLKGKSYT